jgi:hypothetical protein
MVSHLEPAMKIAYRNNSRWFKTLFIPLNALRFLFLHLTAPVFFFYVPCMLSIIFTAMFLCPGAIILHLLLVNHAASSVGCRAPCPKKHFSARGSFCIYISACSISTLDSDNFVIMVRLAEFTRVCAGEHNLARLKCKLVFELTIAKGAFLMHKKDEFHETLSGKKETTFFSQSLF